MSFKLFDETNCTEEFVERDCDPILELETDLLNTDVYHGMHEKELEFLDNPYLSDPKTQERPCIVGRRVYCLHQDEEYVVRRPIRYGNFNISQSYPLQ